MHPDNTMPKPNTRGLFGLFAALAIFYLIELLHAPSHEQVLLKAAPVLVLAVLAIVWRHWLLVAILLCSATGDVLLSLRFEGHFLAGLVAFLVAQLGYLILFARFANHQHRNPKWALTALLALAAAFVGYQILPDEKGLAVAVVVYMLVLIGMATASIWAWQQSFLHVAGALIYVVSDSSLAWNRFHAPLPHADLLIMVTYYVAQGLLVAGILRLPSSR